LLLKTLRKTRYTGDADAGATLKLMAAVAANRHHTKTSRNGKQTHHVDNPIKK